MTPLLLLPLAFVAFVALRAGKSDKPSTPPPTQKPTPQVRPTGPIDGPIVEPVRPGGGTVPKPIPPQRPPVNNPPTELDSPFIGPGPRAPGDRDATPIVLATGATLEDIQAHPLFDYNLFISEDCNLIIEGARWFADTFWPMARFLVLQDPEAYHHSVAVIHELLVAPSLTGDGTTTTPQVCMTAWPSITFSGETLSGTLSGRLVFEPGEPEHDGIQRFINAHQDYDEAFPEIADLLHSIDVALNSESEFVPIFRQPWPMDTGISHAGRS